MEPRIVEGGYLRDVLEQPRALTITVQQLTVDQRLAAIAARLAARGYARVVLSGMGSSYHGLWPLQLRLVGAGHTALLIEASELLHYQQGLLAEDTLLVLLSQSGRSAEIVKLLDEAELRHVNVLGVTNTRPGPLADRATACVLTHAGEEATVSCKTYLAAQAALAFAGAALTGADPARVKEQLRSVPSLVEGYLLNWREHVADLASRLRGVRALYYAGRGASLAAAGTGGLITKEATHHPAEGMSSAAFRHGPLEMLDGDVFLLVFAGDPRTRALNEALVSEVAAAGARAYLASENAALHAFRLPQVPELARPVVELLPVEMITLALAALDGREAGRFERATKITATE